MESQYRFDLAPDLLPSLQHYILSVIFPPLAVLSIFSGPSIHFLLSTICLLLLPYGHALSSLHSLILVYRYYGNSFLYPVTSYGPPKVTTAKIADQIVFAVIQSGHFSVKSYNFLLYCCRYVGSLSCICLAFCYFCLDAYVRRKWNALLVYPLPLGHTLPTACSMIWSGHRYMVRYSILHIIVYYSLSKIAAKLQANRNTSNEVEEDEVFEEIYYLPSNVDENVGGSRQAAMENYILGKLQLGILESLRDYPESWGCRQANCPDTKIMIQLYLQPLMEQLRKKTRKPHSVLERHNQIAVLLKRRSSAGHYSLKTGDPTVKFAEHRVQRNI